MSAPRRHSRKGGTAGAALARVRARRPAEAPAQGGAERVELQRWRDFAESAAEWFWETDARMRVSFVSDAFERQFGLPVSSVLGHRFRDYALVESSRNAEVWSYHDEVIARREPFRDMRYYFRDGEGRQRAIAVSGRPWFDPDGRFRGYRGSGVDLTREWRRELHSRTTAFRLQQALELSSDGIALFDADDRLAFCNHWYRMSSRAFARLMRPGASFEDCYRAVLEGGEVEIPPGETVESCLAARMERHRNPGNPQQVRVNRRWLRVAEQRLADGSTIVTLSDVSTLKQREHALLAAKTEAEQASRAKSDFLARMSHELRTPLNAILGFSDIIRRELMGPVGDARYAAYAQDVFDSGSHLLNLINDILDLSKMEAGRMELVPEDIDLKPLVDEVVHLMREQARKAEVRLHREIRNDGRSLTADPKAMRQILFNLVSNGVKFTPAGGSVRIGVRRRRDGGITVTVRDSGIGIAEDMLPKVLEPFAQADAPAELAAHGTGLGLPIVKSLTELHGARFEISSRPGAGTTVRLRFPPRAA